MGKLSKSSSSSKRKRTKLSSKGNTKKSSKNKRSKSKKYRCRGGSVSYSDDDSLSSTSASSYSSDDSGRRGRCRLQPRKSGKSSKKSRHLSSSSSEDSTRPRKRKRSVRTNDYKRRSGKLHVKKSSRKKAKRELSVSSGSSISCSSDSEYERCGRTHGPRVKDKMKSEIIKDEGRKSRYRSRSSSFSKHDQSGDECYQEPVSSYYTSNRLRSVITVVSEPEGKEDGEMESDFHKEEMIYNDDEYPSCKSNDSNDGGRRREMTDLLKAESKMNRIEEDCQREEESAELAGGRNKLDGQCLSSELLSEMNEAVNKIDDLESNLRQKALENLRKFRGGAQPNSKSCVDAKSTGDTECRMAESSQTKCVKDGDNEHRMAESSQTKCVKGGDNERRMAESSQIKCVEDGDTECRMAESSQVKCVKDDCTSILNEVSFQQSQDHANIPYQDNSTQESKSPEDNVLAMDNEHKGTVKKGIRPCNIKSRLVTSALKAAFLGSDPIPSVISSSEQVHLSKTLGASDPVSGDTTEQSGVPIDPPGGDSSSASASIGFVQEDKPATEDPKSSKSQNEPQLEERTMAVMRGGELVQVSYKVYIPKKTPALARRQLRQ